MRRLYQPLWYRGWPTHSTIPRSNQVLLYSSVVISVGGKTVEREMLTSSFNNPNQTVTSSILSRLRDLMQTPKIPSLTSSCYPMDQMTTVVLPSPFSNAHTLPISIRRYMSSQDATLSFCVTLFLVRSLLHEMYDNELYVVTPSDHLIGNTYDTCR